MSNPSQEPSDDGIENLAKQIAAQIRAQLDALDSAEHIEAMGEVLANDLVRAYMGGDWHTARHKFAEAINDQKIATAVLAHLTHTVGTLFAAMHSNADQPFGTTEEMVEHWDMFTANMIANQAREAAGLDDETQPDIKLKEDGTY